MKLKKQSLMMVLVMMILVSCGGEGATSLPTATRMGHLDRVANLISGYDVAERPLPFSPETVGAKAGKHFVTTDEQVDILLLEVTHQREIPDVISGLAAEGIDVEKEAPYSFVGGNGAILYIVRNVAAPDQRETARWMVSDLVSALAGEE